MWRPNILPLKCGEVVFKPAISKPKRQAGTAGRTSTFSNSLARMQIALPAKPDDARAAGANHLDFDPVVQSKFLDSLNLVRTADDFRNNGRLAAAQTIQRNQVSHCSSPPVA